MRWKKKEKGTPPAPAPKPGGGSGPAKSALELAVAAREKKAALAQRLAKVDVKHLAQAETNPGLLAHADAERDRVHAELITKDRERQELLARREHARLTRDIEDENAWASARTQRTQRALGRALKDADHAADDVVAIEGALDETRPATAATKLARAQEKVVAGFLVFGAVGSVLSAVGIAHTVEAGTSAAWAGAIAAAAIIEIPSTTLASFTIWTQGLLHRHTRAQARIEESDGTHVVVDPMAQLGDRVRTGPWTAVKALLVFSVLVNVFGAAFLGVGLWGVLGAVGAVIAAVSALLGWAYSLQSSAIVSANMASPGVADALDERRRVASGADIPWEADNSTQEPTATATPVGERELSEVLEALLAHEDTRRRVVDVIADMETAINPFPDDASELAPADTDPTPEIEHGPARSDLRELDSGETVDEHGSAVSDLGEHLSETPEEPEHGFADSDQAERSDEEAPTDAATRAAAERADRRRADALALWDEGWSAPEIAAQMGRDKRTVRGYLAEKGVSVDEMDQRIRDRVQAYIEHKGPHAQTRAMAADLHLTRTEAKGARERLAAEGVQVYAPK